MSFVPTVALRVSRVASLGSVLRRAISTQSPRVAVLYQAIDPPVIGGVRKPRKPGGKCFFAISDVHNAHMKISRVPGFWCGHRLYPPKEGH